MMTVNRSVGIELDGDPDESEGKGPQGSSRLNCCGWVGVYVYRWT